MTQIALDDKALRTASNPSGALVLPLPTDGMRLRITERTADWKEEVISRLNHLCELPYGWDGYKAGPVTFSTGIFALRLLEVVCPADAPAPSIVPGVSGDLQIEWHLQGGDIELHVRAPNDVQAWRQIPNKPGGEEHLLTVDFTRVGEWIKALLESTSATRRAAA